MTTDFNDFLTDRDVILMAAWTLPNEGPLSDGQRRQAMGNFRDYLQLHSISFAQVAREIGKPRASTIRELTKGIYREHADAHIRTLNNWVEQNARSRAVKLTGTFVATGVAKQIQAVARLVRENATMGLLVGPTGIGKTHCAQALQQTYVGSILITAIFGAYHPKGFTRLLADQLGVRDSARLQSDQAHLTQLERVLARLRNSNRLLLVDEAHKLQDGAIELLREIHDATGIPILLFATRDLQDRIERSADPDHGQLYSRIDITMPLTQGHDLSAGGDNRPLYTLKEIKELYAQPPVRLSRDAGHYLLSVANDLGRGSLRRCARILINAARRARKRQAVEEGATVTVTADDLEYVEKRFRRSTIEQERIDDRRKVAAMTA